MMETPALIQAAQHGNLHAFNHLVLVYQDTIYGLVRRLLPGRPDAEDITQLIIQKIHKDLHKYHHGSFRIWLYAITVKACRQFRKQRAHRKNQITSAIQRVHTAFDSQPSSADALLDDSQGTNLRDLDIWLGELDFNSRVVLVLVDIEKLNYTQAGYILGLPARLVMRRLAHARRDLLNILTREGQVEKQEESIPAHLKYI